MTAAEATKYDWDEFSGSLVEEVAAANARVGKIIGGQWTLTRILGIGGMSTVYAAVNRASEQVAIKILHADLAQRKHTRMRFLTEGQAARRVHHPGAVSVLGDGVDADGTAYLLLELLAGQTLSERLLSLGPLASSEAVRIGAAILDVLAVAHDRGIVHRDVKPANVFLTQEGTVKLLDFGIARVRDAASANNFITRSGAILGTPAFMAPELASGQNGEIDARTDLWGLAATLFFALTGRLVHPTNSITEALVAAATRLAPSIGLIRPDLAPPLVTVIDRALHLNKEARFPNARAMQQALLSCLQARNATDSVPPISTVVQRSRRPVRGKAPHPVDENAATFLDPRPSRRIATFAAVIAGLIAAGAIVYVGESFDQKLDASPAAVAFKASEHTPNNRASVVVAAAPKLAESIAPKPSHKSPRRDLTRPLKGPSGTGATRTNTARPSPSSLEPAESTPLLPTSQVSAIPKRGASTPPAQDAASDLDVLLDRRR